MSHVSQIRVKVKSLSALKQAVHKLGMQFQENKKTYRAYLNGQGSCDHAISAINIPHADEIGVVKINDSYELRVDSYGGRSYALEQIAGAGCSKLIQTYTQIVAVEEATKLAEAEGYNVNVEEDPQTGETVITLRSYD